MFYLVFCVSNNTNVIGSNSTGSGKNDHPHSTVNKYDASACEYAEVSMQPWTEGGPAHPQSHSATIRETNTIKRPDRCAIFISHAVWYIMPCCSSTRLCSLWRAPLRPSFRAHGNPPSHSNSNNNKPGPGSAYGRNRNRETKHTRRHNRRRLHSVRFRNLGTLLQLQMQSVTGKQARIRPGQLVSHIYGKFQTSSKTRNEEKPRQPRVKRRGELGGQPGQQRTRRKAPSLGWVCRWLRAGVAAQNGEARQVRSGAPRNAISKNATPPNSRSPPSLVAGAKGKHVCRGYTPRVE